MPEGLERLHGVLDLQPARGVAGLNTEVVECTFLGGSEHNGNGHDVCLKVGFFLTR